MPTHASRLLLALRIIGGFAGVLFFVGLGIGSSLSMPRNAEVLLDHRAKTYLAPVCVQNAGGYELSTAADAYALGYRPDPECRDSGAFVQDGRSLSGMLLQSIGVLKPLRSRWNVDGSWNW